MDASSKSITVAGVVTLLLAITAAITLTSCTCNGRDNTYSFDMGEHKITIWNSKPSMPCTKREKNLFWIFGEESTNPDAMLKQLEAESMEPKNNHGRGYFHHEYAEELVCYADPNIVCGGISPAQFVRLVTKCGGEARYEPYANFVQHFAPAYFGPCAHKIIEDLKGESEKSFEQLNEFFGAGLGIESKQLSYLEMYNHIKNVDIAKCKFNFNAMMDVGEKLHGTKRSRRTRSVQTLVRDLKQSLIFDFKVLDRANTVNIALGIGEIKEDELNENFKLFNEYARIAAQLSNKSAVESFKKNLVKKASKPRV